MEIGSSAGGGNLKLRQRIEDEFAAWFLPTVVKSRSLSRLMKSNPDLRTWPNRRATWLVSPPPPPSLASDSSAKPERLGRTNGRLKVLRAFPLQEKVLLASRVLERTIAVAENVAVAFSGGRDSLVALHLTLQRCTRLKVVFVNTSVEFPETLRFVRELAERWRLDFHELRVERNFWELAHERGLPIGGRGNGFFRRELAEAAGVKLSNACCNQLKITPARQFYRKNNIDAQVTGLRVDESMMRRFNFADYGALRYSSDYGTLTAWPLFAWSVADIQEYIALNDLPVNPLYSMGHQRVGCWSCLQDFFKTDSRLFVLRKTHPRIYETLKRHFGEDLTALLVAWGGLQDRGLAPDQFDGLYSPCGLELLDPKARERARARCTNS